jgi:Domain of unknown function (DUF4394)
MKRLVLLLGAYLCLAALPALADEVYVATLNQKFVEYNTLTGAYTVLGTTSPTSLFGMGFNGGVLYANDSISAPSTGLYTVNPTNGALTSAGTISGAISGQGTLTAPVGGGTLYYFTDASTDLFTINPNNGLATTVGPLGFPPSSVGFDLAFAPNGNLYAASNDNFYEINQTTGAATLLGNSGAALQALIAGDGTLYGFAGFNIYSINLSNGALTFVGTTPGALGEFLDGTPVLTTSSVPEPATLILLASAMFVFIGLTAWKKVRLANV